MKPTCPNARINSSRDDRSPRADRFHTPKIECAFRSNSIDDFRSRGGNAVRFRDLSNGYFEQEAQRAFATEAAVFGAILLTVLVPLINSASAVLQLMHSFAL